MSANPEFHTTPVGILSDDDADVIEQNFATAPEEGRPYLAAKLNEYKVFRAHFPKPMNEYEREMRSTDFRTLHGLANDWSGTVAKMPKERRKTLALEGVTDPEPYKQQAFNSAYIDHVTRSPSTGADDYTARRKAYAESNFGGDGADDDARFYQRATSQINDQYNENALLGELGGQAVKAAMAGKPYHAVASAWQSANVFKPGYKQERIDHYVAAGEDVYNEAIQKVGETNDVVSRVLEVMQERTAGVSEKTDSDLDMTGVQKLADEFVSAGYNRAQRDWILQAAAVRAEEMGMDPKGFFKQFGESVVRGGEGVGIGGAFGAGRAVLEVGRNTANRMAQEMTEHNFGQPGYFAGVGAKLEGQIARVDMAEALRRFGDEEIDPIKNHFGGWMGKVESGVYGIGSTLPSLLSVSVPGLIMQATSMSNDTYMELREKHPEMSEGAAQAVALPAGAIMGALDRVEAMIAFGGLGKGALGKGFREWLGDSYLKNIGASAAGEFLTETAQNFVPVAVQELESKFSDAIPDPEFWEEAKTLLAQSPETFIAVFPLAMLGGVGGVKADKKAARAMLTQPDVMRMAGLGQESIDTITMLAADGKVDEAVVELRSAWATRDKGVSMAENVSQAYTAAREQASAQTARAAAAGVTVKRRQEDGQWEVRDGDGNSTVHADWSAAEAELFRAAGESSMEIDAPVVEALAGFSQNATPGESFQVTEQRRTAATAIVEALAAGDESLVSDIFNRVEIEKQRMGKAGENLTADDFSIHGDNTTLTDAQGEVVEYASRIHQGAQVIDLIEEKAEGDAKRWVQTNRTSTARLAQLVQQVEQATGQTHLYNFDPADPNGAQSQQAVIEAYSSIAKAYATGTSAKGDTAAQSRVTRALGSQLGAQQRRTMAQLRNAAAKGIGGKMMQAIKDTWDTFRVAVGAAAKVTATLDADASLDEIRTMLMESIGLTPAAKVARDVDKAVAEEVRAQAASTPPEPNPQALREKTNAWDRANKNTRADEWFEGGKANEGAVAGFNEALAAGGSALQAHGMSKESTLSGAVDNLLNLLTNGLDATRGGGRLDTAPLVSKAGEGLVGATASGSAYTDGPFLLVGKNGQTLSGDLSGLGAVLVNPAHGDITPELRAAIQAIRPDVIVGTFADAGSVAKDLVNGVEARPAKSPPLPAVVTTAPPDAPPNLPSLTNVTMMPDGTWIAGPTTMSLRARHGAGAGFDKFSADFVGEGIGAQVYGWGIYFTDTPEIAQDYQAAAATTAGLMNVDGETMTALEALERWPGNKEKMRGWWNDWARNALAVHSGLPPAQREVAARKAANQRLAFELQAIAGSMGMNNWKMSQGFAYEVDIDAELADMLNFATPAAAQGSTLTDALHRLADQEGIAPIDMARTGDQIYRDLSMVLGGDKAASQALFRAGVKGSFHDAAYHATRGVKGPAGAAPRNYVVFDDSLIAITRKAEGPVSWSMVARQDPMLGDKSAGQYQLTPLNEQPVEILDNGTIIHPPTSWAIYWHGSAGIFDKFSLKFMGTGEGAQAYGWGLYFAQAIKTAKSYRQNLAANAGLIYVDKERMTLTEGFDKLIELWGDDTGEFTQRKQLYEDELAAVEERRGGASYAYLLRRLNKETIAFLEEMFGQLRDPKVKFEEYRGSMYKVDIPFEPEELLSWDWSIEDQPEHIQAAIAQLSYAYPGMQDQIDMGEGDPDFDYEGAHWKSGAQIYQALATILGSDKAASKALLGVGIKGIAYLDADSRWQRAQGPVKGQATKLAALMESLVGVAANYMYFEAIKSGDLDSARTIMDEYAEARGWVRDPALGRFKRRVPVDTTATPSLWRYMNERPLDLLIKDGDKWESLFERFMNGSRPPGFYDNRVTLNREDRSVAMDNSIEAAGNTLRGVKKEIDRLKRGDGGTHNVVIFDDTVIKTLRRDTHGQPPATMSLRAMDQDITNRIYHPGIRTIETSKNEGGKVRSIAHKYRQALEDGGVAPVPMDGTIKSNPERSIEEASERLVTILERAREAFPQFVSWYDKRIKMAIAIVQQLDPDLKKPDDLFAFKIALAITSNGNAVGAQTEYAWDVYQNWKKTGKLSGMAGMMGTRTKDIQSHLGRVDAVIGKLGIQGAKKWFDKIGTVNEAKRELVDMFGVSWKVAGEMLGDELVDEVVPYAILFGAKLGSFYNNLNGNFDTITMDRWFVRTITRTMGTQLIKRSKAQVAATTRRFKSALADARKAYTKKGHPWMEQFADLKDIGDIAKTLNKFGVSGANRATLKGHPVLDELRKAANEFYKFGDGYEMREAPDTGWERRIIRLASRRAIAKFKEATGIEFSPAEYQAILWYYEKAVHEKHGSKPKEASPDYASGANELHKKLKGENAKAFVYSEAMLPPYSRGDWDPAKARPAQSTARGNTTFSLAPVNFRAQQKGYLSETSDEVGPVAEWWQINLPNTYWHGSDIMLPVGATPSEALAKVVEKYQANPEAQASLEGNPEAMKALRTFSMRTADYVDDLAKRFVNPDLAPAARVTIYTGARRRLEGLARSIRHNEGLETALTLDGLQKQATVIRRAAYARLKGEGKTPVEARITANEEAETWLADKIRNLPATREEADDRAVYRAMLALEQMLAPFPAEVRAAVGGMIQLAQKKTQKARRQFLMERADRAMLATEAFLQRELRQEISDVFDRARPTGGAGDRRQGKLGAYIHRWFDRAETYAHMTIPEVDAQIARWEKVVKEAQAGDVPDEVMDELNSRWGAEVVVDQATVIDQANEELALANAVGATLWTPPRPDPVDATDADWAEYARQQKTTLPAAELDAGFNLLDTMYENGRSLWMQELARRREEAQAFREQHLLPGLGQQGKPATATDPAEPPAGATPDEVLKGGQPTGPNRGAALSREQMSFEQTVADIFSDAPEIREWADTWERDAAVSEKTAIDERNAAIRQALQQALGTRSIIELNRRLAALAIPEDLNLPGLKTGSQLELASLVMRYGEANGPEWLEEHGYGEKFQEAAQAKLKPETKAIMGWIARQFDADYNRINAVYYREKGVDLPRVAGYAGMRSSERGSETQELSVDGNAVEGGLSSGFTKTRVTKPAGPPKIENILAQYIRHAHQVEHYVAWAKPMREMRQRLGHRDVMMTIEARRGRRARGQVNDWLNIFDQGGVRQAGAQSVVGAWLRRMMSAQSEAALAFNLGTRLKQMPAGIQALAELRFGQFAAGLARVATGTSRLSPLEIMRSPVMAQRRDDWRDASVVLQARLGRYARQGRSTNFIRNSFLWAFNNLSAVDAAFTGIGAAVAYDAAWQEARALPDAQRRAHAERRAAQVVSRTAQPNRPGTKSLWENQANVYAKLFFRFQSANRQVLANQVYALKHWKKDPARALRVMVLAHFIIPSMIQVIANVLKHAMTDKEKEEIWEIEDFVLAWIMGPISGLILIGPIIESLAAKFKGFAPRMAGLPVVDILERTMREWNDSETNDEDFRAAAALAGLAIGGDVTALNAMDQIWRQLLGVKKSLDAARDAGE